MKLYINPHTHSINIQFVVWDAQLNSGSFFEPYVRYYVEVPMLTSIEGVENTLSNLSVFFSNNRTHQLMFCAIPIKGYGTDIGTLRIYEDEQTHTFAELTDGVLDSKEKYFHGA